ncbi:hypothetical protein Micbo1qcDRAFT_209080 [Microdochium bolleyi]|uniref:Uncharacterized protein n=1 Tax=Microdochium bolleyi TaxID=196109 RepID=A0A136IN61_9PEZI|nr:hypothetical protein Micbo1qcDRAFT_209080 [Microdochium bolleyi]
MLHHGWILAAALAAVAEAKPCGRGSSTSSGVLSSTYQMSMPASSSLAVVYPTVDTTSSSASSTASTTDSASSTVSTTASSVVTTTESGTASITESSSVSSTTSSSTSSSTVDACLQALVQQGQVATADCSARLIVTETPAASTMTQTVTATNVGSTVDSTFFTETTSTTAATETLFFTVTTTATASQTDVITEPAVVSTTTTSTVTAPATFTTTSYSYLALILSRGLDARSTRVVALPPYATEACGSWNEYVSACGQLGVSTSTVTLAPATETATATVTASSTTTLSTVSSTQTDVVSLTATESTTQTDLATVIVVTTTTTTSVSTLTQTATTTATPTSVVTKLCRAKGVPFRVFNPPPAFGASIYYLGVQSAGARATWEYSNVALDKSTFVVNPDGFFEMAVTLSGATEILVAMRLTSENSLASTAVLFERRSIVEDRVAAGLAVKLGACVDQSTGNLLLDAGMGRTNFLACFDQVSINPFLYLTRSNGADTGLNCNWARSIAI